MAAKELKEELLKVASDIEALLSEIEEDNIKIAEEAKVDADEVLEKEAQEQRSSYDMGTLGDIPSKGSNPLLDFILS